MRGKAHATAWKSCRCSFGARWLQSRWARWAGSLGGPRWVQLSPPRPSHLPPGAEPGCWAPWQRLVTARCHHGLCRSGGKDVCVPWVKVPVLDKIKQITTLRWWRWLRSQLVRHMVCLYAFLGGWGEQFQQDRAVFVNVLVSLFRAYWNTRIFAVHKELPQGNEDLGSSVYKYNCAW